MKKKTGLSVITPYLYIMPISLILLTFVAGSLIIAIYFSFTKYNIITPATFNGLYNYKKLLGDSKLRVCIINTLKIALIVVPTQIICSTLFAVLIASKQKTLLGKLAKAALFIPVLSSSAVIGTVWKALLNGGSPVTMKLFGIFGINPTLLLGSSKTAIVTLSLLIVWKGMGYYMIITLSALMSIPNSYYEAARVDGASSWVQLKSITLPLLKPTIIMNTFLATISSMQVFDMAYTLTGGGPSMSTTTLVMYAYDLTFKNAKAGYAMTVSNVLMILILIIILFQQRFIRRDASES